MSDTDNNKEKKTAERQLLDIIESQESNQKKEPKQASINQPSSSEIESRDDKLDEKGVTLEQEDVNSETETRTNPILDRKKIVLSPNVLKGRFIYLQENLLNNLKFHDLDFTLNFVNYSLAFVIAVMFIFLILSFTLRSKKLGNLSEAISIKMETKEEGSLLKPLQNLSYYLEKISQRDIFKPKQEKIEKVQQQQAYSTIHETIKTLRLVGISPSEEENENYAMIEDTKTQGTFFLKEGQTIAGLSIVKITQDKVILSDGTNNEELK